jgi:parvulin-like peptidyl-prolyl isomerase
MNAPILQLREKVIQIHDIPLLLKRYQVMSQIWRGIVIDQAIADINCTESEKITAIAEFEKQQQITSIISRQNWLQNQDMTLEEMEDLAVRNLKITKFKTATWGNKAESYFLKRKASLDQVIYSLIRTKNQGIASELYFRIQEKEESFAELARAYSQGLEAYTGGIMGPVPLSQTHPLISKLLSISKPGQLWSPCQVGEWIVILRLEKLLPAQFDEVIRQKLIDELFEQWLKEQIKSLSHQFIIDVPTA